jgi:NTE family protein
MPLRTFVAKLFSVGLAMASLLSGTIAHRASAQTAAPAQPGVGVALSGGGALGLAHIGVLRYFEEHRIPIGEIGGTSMGGLVGGLYASGMNSTQLTHVVEQADWDALLNPTPQFTDQPVVDKQKWNVTYGKITLRLGKGFSLPVGLNPGEALSLLLSRTTQGYSNVASFDDLPTPFRCVATDLVSGNAVILDRGSLAQAMRSTMSLPAIFTPVKTNGMVLVDGGIVQNIPVDAVRGMGAKTVIAVALETPETRPETFKSLADVLRQTVSVAVLQNERRSLAAADLVISVDTKKFSSTDYAKWKEIIAAGYEAAKAKSDVLAKYEVSEEAWAQYQQRRKDRMRPGESRGAVVAVSSPVPSFQQKAEEEIHRKLGDQVVSQKKLENVLSGMVAATNVPGASYEWQSEPGKEPGYKVNFAQRTSDQVLARLSFQYSLSPGEPGRASLRLAHSLTFRDAYKDRLLGTLNIGYDPSARFEYYFPFGGSPYFVAAGVNVERYHVNRYDGPERQSDTRDRFSGYFYSGIGTWRFVQMRLGAQAGYDSYSRTRTEDGVKANSGGFAAPELRWIYNTQDSGGLPTHGSLSEGAIGYSFRNVTYPYLQQEFSTFHPLGRALSLFVINQDNSSFGRKLDSYEKYTAGGQGQLSAFRYQEFHANTSLTAGSGILLHAPTIQRLSMLPNFGIWYEAGRFDLGAQGWKTHQSTSGGLFFPTPIGIGGISVSFDENGKARFRLLLGSL